MKWYITSVLFLAVFATTLSAQPVTSTFFDNANSFFAKHVRQGRVDYKNLKGDAQLASLLDAVAQAELRSASDATKEAFYINAYNLLVIGAAVQAYPLASVQDVPGFFDRTTFPVAGERITLNNLEKNRLIRPYQDARLHFVLVCGALGCPPITDFAYYPDRLEQQLDMQTKLALNDPNFIRISNEEVGLSQIFDWYQSDFGKNPQEVIRFINNYRQTDLPLSGRVRYYPYDWSLNDAPLQTGGLSVPPTNAARYIVSSTIPKGTFEIKLFNNLYSQRTGSEGNLTDRSTFLTSTQSVLFGLTDRLNVGLFSRYRRVANEALPVSPLHVFSGGDSGSFRQGLTGLGPQIRFAPVPKWQNFSIQSAFLFAIGDDLSGSATQPFIEWDGPIWITQIFNDFPIGDRFSLFTEVAVWWEDIGSEANGHINRLSTPATAIFSFNANRKTIFYVLGSYSPFWQEEFDYFYQGGFGAKYQFTPNLELELLYTDFTNQFLQNSGGQAATYNLGFRINI